MVRREEMNPLGLLRLLGKPSENVWNVRVMRVEISHTEAPARSEIEVCDQRERYHECPRDLVVALLLTPDPSRKSPFLDPTRHVYTAIRSRPQACMLP
jgi:hypothetical protein